MANRNRGRRKRKPLKPLPPPDRSLRLYARVAPEHLAKMKFLIEGEDNLAYMSVVDRFEAVVQIVCSPHQERELRAFLAGLPIPFTLLDICPAMS